MVERVYLKTQVYEYIKSAIVNNELNSESIYSEQQFADLLNVSRTPIREAVLRLNQEKLVTIHPNKGFSLRLMNRKELRELFEFRYVLEGYCCQLIVNESDGLKKDSFIRELEELLSLEEETIDEQNDSKHHMEVDFEFHYKIIEYSSNSLISNQYYRLRNQMSILGIESYKRKGRPKQTLDEHKEITNALRKKDDSIVLKILNTHLTNAEDILASMEIRE
ncbi:MAG: GntR family transcriptional regulator [Tissierellia bacterium]|nr:GntR family transcriptional regulator [Tissierellia bacterium]